MIPRYSLKEIAIHSLQPECYHIERFEEMTDPEGIQLPHTHNFYSMVWFTHGAGVNVIDFNEYEICPNRLFYTTPHCIHNWSYTTDAKGYVVIFTQLAAQSTNYNKKPYIDLTEEDMCFFNTNVSHLLNEYNNNDNIAHRSIIQGLQFLITTLERKFPDENPQNRSRSTHQFTQLNELITQQELPIQQISYYADKLKITERELNTICIDISGKTAKQYILDQYLTEGKRLLLYTDANVNEIAYSLGFDDSSYFIRLFKKKNGLTPIQYRETSH